jgi:hypothetical protein
VNKYTVLIQLTLTPDSSSNCCTEPMATRSSPITPPSLCTSISTETQRHQLTSSAHLHTRQLLQLLHGADGDALMRTHYLHSSLMSLVSFCDTLFLGNKREVQYYQLALTPDSSSSCCTEPMATRSSPSSDVHSGMGVPQKRERDTFQSLASASQLWNRFSLTKDGTQYVDSLLASSLRAGSYIVTVTPQSEVVGSS